MDFPEVAEPKPKTEEGPAPGEEPSGSGGGAPGEDAPGAGAIGAGGDDGAIGAGSSGPKSYDQLVQAGPTYTGDLDTAISTNADDKAIDGPDIDDRYHKITFPAEPANDALKPYIQGDVDSSNFVRYRLANIKDSDGNIVPDDQIQTEANVFTQISVSKDTGTIVNEYSYADKDTLKATGGAMRFSDQCFQAWGEEGGTDGLNTLIQQQVQNQPAKDAMVKGHRDRGVPLSKPQTWGPDDDTYKALTGSDNGRPFIYMLKDHHGALGNKKVNQITTIPEPNAIIVFNLGPA